MNKNIQQQLSKARVSFKVNITMVLFIGIVLTMKYWASNKNIILDSIMFIMAAIFCYASFKKLRLIRKLYSQLP